MKTITVKYNIYAPVRKAGGWSNEIVHSKVSRQFACEYINSPAGKKAHAFYLLATRVKPLKVKVYA